jgi:hypothetical protein
MTERPWNPPGLDRVRYRVGTFDSFRRAMLDELPSRLSGWRENDAAPDRATALVEAWAYLADNLTMYTELAANEALLPTATQPDSLRRLGELVGYRPNPGAAAVALLALSIDPARRGEVVTVPEGLRVGGRATPETAPAVFETDQAVDARAEHNRIPLAATAPANQFAPLAALATVDALSGAAADLGGRGTSGASSGDYNQIAAELGQVFPLLASSLLRTGTRPVPPPEPSPVPDPFSQALPDPTGAARRAVTLYGTGLRLRAGDHVLVLDRSKDGVPAGEGLLRQVSDVREDRRGGRTVVEWIEDDTVYATAPGTAPAVYALNEVAAPFGANAPAYAGLPAEVKGTGRRFPDDWDSGVGRWLPDGDASTQFLDRAVDGVAAGSQRDPSCAVLVDLAGTSRHYRTFRITGADAVTHLGLTIEARVTRLVLSAQVPASTFLRRATAVLLVSRRLVLDDRRPLPQAVAGDRLLLAGRLPDLVPGQAAILTSAAGVRPDAGPPGRETVVAESVTVDSATVLAASGLTAVTLREPLTHVHRRSTAALLGNVVPASHGETVPTEILGSGDGTAWQAFALRKSPLTYVPDHDGSLRSTLRVTVDGVRWTEVESVAGRALGEAAYVLETDPADDGVTVVRFGDVTSRPPTGRDNVVARYRGGIGAVGAVPAGGITRLVDSLAGLRGVVNPLPAEGAADPEGPAAVRRNAPAALRTMDRAVSVEDHADLALTFPGVERARARLVPAGSAGAAGTSDAIYLAVAGSDRLPLSREGAARLRRFLDARRDPNRPLRIVAVETVAADLSVVVDVDDRYGQRTTIARVRAALAQRTNPDGSLGYLATLGFGQALRLSGVYAAVQAVPGVARAVVTRLAPATGRDDPGAVLDSVPVPATGLVLVADDPADAARLHGRLVVTRGAGGFAE